MALLQEKPVLSCLLVLCMSSVLVSSGRTKRYTSPSVPRLTDSFPHVSISKELSNAFGGSNVQVTGNGSMATLALDKSSGSGLVSVNKYHYGFFSAAIKLPAGDSSGVVVAFYLSNANIFPHNHDEIDIELLGHDRRNDWVIQTNVYANGSVSTGREEKFYLWFDPTTQHHQYTIIWNNHHIVFLVDNIPVREFAHSGTIFPSKPMSLYTTIWDGSEWATHGGKYGVNYKNAPYKVSLVEVEMSGCIANPRGEASCSKSTPSSLDPVEGPEVVKLSNRQVSAMDWARRKLMFYSYCKDTSRYKVMPAECK